MPCAAQSGLLEARILEGDGQTIQPGSRLPHPLILEVTDETGTRVSDALVSFQLPEDGASGRFHNGLRTEILKTGENGRVALQSLETGIIAGQFQIRMMVAKGGARTGAVSNQYISQGEANRSGGSHLGAWRPSRRVLEVSALVIVAAAVGYSKIGHGTSASTVETQPTIGTPTISVGK